jgi:3-hydroxybutyryl-CoA dehydratase
VKAGTGLDGSGVWYDEVVLGASFARTLTITDAHLVLGAGLTGDFNPHHIDDAFARRSRFGTRILHGVVTSALMGAPVGMYFHGTAIAYLEHATRFKAPVRPGDTLTTTWTVTALDPKPQHGGGVVTLAGVARNQDGAIVAEAEGKMLVAARAGEQGKRASGEQGPRAAQRQGDASNHESRSEADASASPSSQPDRRPNRARAVTSEAIPPAPPRTRRRARARGR